ncbi:hypothetical protein MCOR34_010802 [Pyricularia oryzae]|uniref:Zn(2)-C6 fungal-type domain-containing protein n=1 Tax=Pyricularia oryzae TaxID=318829 RepID=A0A4P7MW37_PYROR|nr:hypothetical protein MCOR34_010802 [Pyricularia oryzae]QBZ54317.1 hypothetical protein PoMZ_10013 [Pyricularia oryzae]
MPDPTMYLVGDAHNAASPPVMKRRAHRKSRSGCDSCKMKRKKCDEARPACSQCVKSNRSCNFRTGMDAASVNVLGLTGERTNPRSPVNQSSEFTEAQKSRSNNAWNYADKKAVTEELERLSNRQNEIVTVVNQLLKDLKSSINRQVRDEMTAVVLKARSMRQKQELAQALTTESRTCLSFGEC